MANRTKRGKYIVNSYSVIEFEDEEEDCGGRLFECIPDSWFVDETKKLCYFPPRGTKRFSLRAINCDKPDDTWYVLECKVVSGGYSTYAAGFKIVKEKCSQKYNTSSAEDHIEAATYRRKHPVLSIQGEFERVFSEKNSTTKIIDHNVGEGHNVQSEQRQEISTEVIGESGDANANINDSMFIERQDESNRVSKCTSDSNKQHLRTDHSKSKPVSQLASNSTRTNKVQKSNKHQHKKSPLDPKNLNLSSVININEQLSSQHTNESLQQENGSTSSRTKSSSRRSRSHSRRSVSRRSRSRSEKRASKDHSMAKSVSQLASTSTDTVQKSNKHQHKERPLDPKNLNLSSVININEQLSSQHTNESLQQENGSTSSRTKSSSRRSRSHSRRSVSRRSRSRSEKRASKDHSMAKSVSQLASTSTDTVQKSNKHQHKERPLDPKTLNSSSVININEQLSSQHTNESLPQGDNGSWKRKRRSSFTSSRTKSSSRRSRSYSRRSVSRRSRSRSEKRARKDHSKVKTVGQLASTRTNDIQKSNTQHQNERRSNTNEYKKKKKSSPKYCRPSGRNGRESSSDCSRSISGRSRSISGRSRSTSGRSRSTSIRSNSSSRNSSTRSRRSNSRCPSSRSSRPNPNYRRSQSHTSRSKSGTSRSMSNSRRLSSHLGRSESRPSLPQPRSAKQTLEDIQSEVKQLIKFNKDFKKWQIEHERRLNRIEVTVNKTFITVGDWTNTNTNNFQVRHNNRMSIESEAEMDEFEVPKLPILKLNELRSLNRELKNRRFRKFLINHQRHFCAPSKTATDTVTLTKYLHRFISLSVRCDLTLKEKTKSGYTLMGDYHRVYLFVIDVMREGYKLCGKTLNVVEAHAAVRTVWGRSKQLKNDEDQKKRKRKRLDDKKKKRRH